MTDDESLQRVVDASLPLAPGKFMCEMCHGVFRKNWTDTQAAAEALHNGVNMEEPVGLVCTDCYRLTPWGRGT